MDGREGTVRDFADRCSGIIMEAIKWAPETTRSLLQVSGDMLEVINNKINNEAYNYSTHITCVLDSRTA